MQSSSPPLAFISSRPPRARRGVSLVLIPLLAGLLLAGASVGGFFYQRAQAALGLARADRLAGAGDCPAAIQAYVAALNVWPPAAPRHDTQALVGRAACYLQAGQYAQAIADLDKALGRDPGHVPAYLLRAEARLARGETQGAIGDVQQALAVDPAAPGPYLLRARIEFGRSNFAAAAADAGRAAALYRINLRS